MRQGNACGAKGRRKVKGVKAMQMDRSMKVSSMKNNHIEEARYWLRAEPCVWTDRMLAALVRGVRNGKWHSLIDKVYDMSTLRRAWEQVRKNNGAAGVDRQSVAFFSKDVETHLRILQGQLKSAEYTPLPVLRCWIDKPGSSEKRPLGIPAVKDRIVQSALQLVIGPIFEHTFAPTSFGFRPRRGCKDALREVDRLLNAGYTWVVDADLKSYFDTIVHTKLMDYVKEAIADGRILGLIESYLKAGILDGLSLWEPETGTPQGAVISPLLANIYLNGLDHEMANRGFHMIRYADDFVVLCRNQEEAVDALATVTTYTADHDLCLHPEKTRLVDASEKGGFDFLGYHFERGYKWPSKKLIKKLKDKLRPKTKRTNGTSLDHIIREVNKTTRGWFGYFKHSLANTFPEIDGWIRGRIRSILRKRRKRKGRARGRDHHRRPNVFFIDHGYFGLEAAHRSTCQSLRRATH